MAANLGRRSLDAFVPGLWCGHRHAGKMAGQSNPFFNPFTMAELDTTHWQEWLFVGGYVSFLVIITWLVVVPRK